MCVTTPETPPPPPPQLRYIYIYIYYKCIVHYIRFFSRPRIAHMQIGYWLGLSFGLRLVSSCVGDRYRARVLYHLCTHVCARVCVSVRSILYLYFVPNTPRRTPLTRNIGVYIMTVSPSDKIDCIWCNNRYLYRIEPVYAAARCVLGR